MGYRGNYVTTLDWDTIAKLYAAGDGVKAIAKSVGASPAGIREGLIKRGLYQFGQNRKRNAVGVWAGRSAELDEEATIWRRADKWWGQAYRRTAMEKYYGDHAANKERARNRVFTRYWTFEKVDAYAQAVRNVRRILVGIVRNPTKRRKRRKEDILGCSYDEARAYLASQFTDGQSWENYGTLWEIDHKIPLARFDLLDPQQLRQAAHYTNLRPLDRTLNRRLGGAIRRVA